MTEKEIRSKVVEIAKGWLGCKESDGSHKKIIDTYNACKPLPRSYAVKYTDAWCATFASAVGIKAGLTDIIPRECSCNQFIQLAKNMGIWVENDAYTPSAGDMILYDWDDNGVGDNTGSADHIGIVVSVSGGVIKVIEGNKSNAVGYRDLAPTIKMVQALDRENHTTILKDMIEQAELKDKHKHLLQLEKSTIEERIDTAVPQENDGIF